MVRYEFRLVTDYCYSVIHFYMAFKINSRTRIKVPDSKLRDIFKDSGYQHFYEFRFNFKQESGLKDTSNRWSTFKREMVYYLNSLFIEK